MTDFDTASAFAAALVDEWARCGVTRAVVAPGSRSTPLALALVRDARITVDVVLDERSASFRALGIARASGLPAVLCCTSGTAAANFHPAVLEASHAHVPLIVATADRPPELRDTGAGQTIDQTKLYGDAVRWYCDPGPPELPENATWRALACRAVAAALGPPAGPVHCNLPFREPLVPTGAQLPDTHGRADGRPWTVTTTAAIEPDATTVARLAATVRANPRGALVAGWGARVRGDTVERFARAAGWPVLADPISGARAGDHAVSTYEALLRVDGFGAAHRPDLVVRVGAPPTSKVVGEWLDGEVAQIVVDPDGGWLDPRHAASERVVVDADALLGALAAALERDRADGRDQPWLTAWLDAERAARVAMDQVLDDARTPYEGVIARDLAAMLPDGASLVVASSLPVRALEWCMAPRSAITVHANRGVNGIDGFVSTAGGIAVAAHGPVVALCGDLCFLHDSNGLLGAPTRAPVTYVVIDNDGGGIFSFLPQAPLPEFEMLFGTPHGLDLVAVAEAHGVVAERIDDWRKLEGRLDATETQVLVIPVDRAASVDRHRELWSAVAAAIGGGA